MDEIKQKLLENSKASQLACIEIHNKPIFPFRYEVCAILNINSWELALKAFILNYHKDVKVINEDNTTKPFEECLGFVASKLGKDFIVAKENIERIYQFRCNVIHFYQEDVCVLLFFLLGKNVLLYHEFLQKHFGIDISEEVNLLLMPIGFKSPVSPIDFLSKNSNLKESSPAVQNFIKNIITSTQQLDSAGINDSILFKFNMAVINENRVSNADIVAAISKDSKEAVIKVQDIITKYAITGNPNETGTRKVKIEEESMYETLYRLTYEEIIKQCRAKFSDFSQNKKFSDLMATFKGNESLHKKRYLNIQKQSGGSKDFYTEKALEELSKHYTIKN